MGDGRVEGLSAIEDERQTAISLIPDADGMHVHIFESLKLEVSYIGELAIGSHVKKGVDSKN